MKTLNVSSFMNCLYKIAILHYSSLVLIFRMSPATITPIISENKKNKKSNFDMYMPCNFNKFSLSLTWLFATYLF